MDHGYPPASFGEPHQARPRGTGDRPAPFPDRSSRLQSSTVRVDPVGVGYTKRMLAFVWVPLIPFLALALLLGAERFEHGLDASRKVD